MNQRERLLATVVGLLLVAVIGFVVVEKVRGAFRQRANARTQVQSELNRKQQIIDHAARTVGDLAAYEQMSLPSDTELARSQYQAWLSQIVDRVGLKEPQVKVVSQSRLANDCTQLACSVTGRGNLQQLTKLLHEFYSVNTIHRIRRLPLRPIPDSKELRIDLSVEALILATAPGDKTFDVSPVSELAQLPVEKVIDPIIQRNMFSPANRPPQIEAVSRSTVHVGEAFAIELKARDPDTLDNVSFRLDAGAPEGLRLDPGTGRIRWLPRAVGQYSVTVAASDDGIPARTTRHTIQLEVDDPPPPPVVATNDAEPAKLGFDDARFTYAIAMLEVAGERQLWLQVRTSGKILKLVEGDPVRIGSIDATVSRIGERDVELATNGETIHIQVGEPLVSTK